MKTGKLLAEEFNKGISTIYFTVLYYDYVLYIWLDR